jgi:hypothetical protein
MSLIEFVCILLSTAATLIVSGTFFLSMVFRFYFRTSTKAR